LYCSYFNADLQLIEDNSVSQAYYYQYQQGPTIDQDFTAPVDQSQVNNWIHSDIAITTSSFYTWSLTGIDGIYYNQHSIAFANDPSSSFYYDYVVHSDDSSGDSHLKLARNLYYSSLYNGTLLSQYLPSNVLIFEIPILGKFQHIILSYYLIVLTFLVELVDRIFGTLLPLI
jgi:hypothetical protein